MGFSFSALSGGDDEAVERERQAQDDPQVIEGNDDLPRQSRMPRDSYVVEPGPTPGERRAFRLLPLVWIVVLVLAGIILYAVFR